MSLYRLIMGAAVLALGAAIATPSFAQKKYDTGATDTEIKIGQTIPLSGPASAYGGIGRVQAITRPQGTPIEHTSIPFQISMQGVTQQMNQKYQEDQMADMLHQADMMQTTIEVDKARQLEEKFDPEMRFRPIRNTAALVVTALLIVLSCFHYYTAGFGLLPETTHRGIHIAFVLGLIFLVFAFH